MKVAVVYESRTGNTAELAELILHSSCTPPVTPLFRRDGRAVVDGGIVDSVPVDLVSHASSQLVLLTRRYPSGRLPRVPGRTYVQPSAELPIAVWDYANPDGLRRTYEQGIRDGRDFVGA